MTIQGSGNDDTHLGIRIGAIELIRCTEQTAILMAGAEGRGIDHNALAAMGAMSMAGYMSKTIYRPNWYVRDEVYERGKAKSGKKYDRTKTTDAQAIWQHLTEMPPLEPTLNEIKSLDLDCCFSPVDGKHAMCHGDTGGTISAMCCGIRAKKTVPVFAPPRAGSAVAGKGRPGHAAISPPWLVLSGSAELLKRVGGMERLHHEFVELASKCVGKPIESMINKLFTDKENNDNTDALPITVHGAVAVLGEPRGAGLPWRIYQIPNCRTRKFTGSSIAASLASMFRNKGFDAFIGVTRHLHAIHCSVAAKTLGGFVLAVPISFKKGNRDIFVIDEGNVWTHNDFVRQEDAVMFATGISENVVLKAVRTDFDSANVHSLIFSARTHSVRNMETRISLKDVHGGRFASFSEDSLLSKAPKSHTQAKSTWDSAKQWISYYNSMFHAAPRTVGDAL